MKGHSRPEAVPGRTLAVDLTDRQHALLRAAAERAGMTPDAYAAQAVKAALARRYALKKPPGEVLEFQALKRPRKR